MNSERSIGRFMKDGLVGVSIALVIGLGPLILFTSAFEDLTLVAWIIAFMLFFVNGAHSPMAFAAVAACLGSGLGGLFLRNVATRFSWLPISFFVALLTWLMGLGSVKIYFHILQSATARRFDYDWNVILTASGYGALFGLLLGILGGMIFNPKERSDQIKIVALVSAVVGLGLAVGILLPQIYLE